MRNLNSFCTCKDLKCPFHPTNHDKGCTPCIAKNLKHSEIPSCFFNTLDGVENLKDYTYNDFADAVKNQRK